jgi:hypothetical protein
MAKLTAQVIAQVSERLGQYVYLLVDPRDGRPFYVGKGRGVRMLAHGLEAEDVESGADGAKLARIRDIRAAGLEHEIWIARYGMTVAEYTAVEAALIDVLASFPVTPLEVGATRRPLALRDELTNARREDARGKGLIQLDRLVDELAAPVLDCAVPLLLITLNPWKEITERIAGDRTRRGSGFKLEWADPALRDRDISELEMATASWWVVSPSQVARRRIEHVVPLFRGVTRALLRIKPDSWERDDSGRWGFVATPVTAGVLYGAIVGPHGHRVPGRARGAQNPIFYWPR